MASSKAYLEFILEQLSELEEITYRAMMGEYIIYYREKIIGGIYDDRLLVKPVKSAIRYMPTASCELPYEGAKEMLLVDEVDDKAFLTGLFRAMYEELPAPGPKNKKGRLHLSPASDALPSLLRMPPLRGGIFIWPAPAGRRACCLRYTDSRPVRLRERFLLKELFHVLRRLQVPDGYIPYAPWLFAMLLSPSRAGIRYKVCCLP